MTFLCGYPEQKKAAQNILNSSHFQTLFLFLIQRNTFKCSNG